MKVKLFFIKNFGCLQRFSKLALFLELQPKGKAPTNVHALLENISNLSSQACLCAWPPRQTLLDKHIMLVKFQKLVTSKVCLSGTCLHDGQID